jgi:hypothetical protein
MTYLSTMGKYHQRSKSRGEISIQTTAHQIRDLQSAFNHRSQLDYQEHQPLLVSRNNYLKYKSPSVALRSIIDSSPVKSQFSQGRNLIQLKTTQNSIPLIYKSKMCHT